MNTLAEVLRKSIQEIMMTTNGHTMLHIPYRSSIDVHTYKDLDGVNWLMVYISAGVLYYSACREVR